LIKLTLSGDRELLIVWETFARWVRGSRWNPDTQSWSKSSASYLQELKWPSFLTYPTFSVSLAHDILHQRISIPFNKHFQFSKTNMLSHPLSLCIPSTTINPYCHSFFFVNTPLHSSLHSPVVCISLCTLSFSCCIIYCKSFVIFVCLCPLYNLFSCVCVYVIFVGSMLAGYCLLCPMSFDKNG